LKIKVIADPENSLIFKELGLELGLELFKSPELVYKENNNE